MVAAQTASGFFPSPGETIAGKYEIERMLGQGGMGAVFSAINRLTGRRVALKWVLPEKATELTRARLLREAQATCSVSHPNVVDVYDVCEHEGGLFIVMEYLQGDPLSALLDLRGLLQPEELVALLMPAMRGVQAAHDVGIIHRDLKPDNILLCDTASGDLLPKVLDFGISKTLGGGDRLHTSLTNTGALIGTPHFMALEQVDGSGDVDVRTDVYAFGVMLYLGLTGQLPFDGENIGELILKIGTREAIPPREIRPSIPPGLDAIVVKAMARRREERFSSVAELALALEPYSGGVPFQQDSRDMTAPRIPLVTNGRDTTRAAQTPTSMEPPGGRRRWGGVVVFAALVLLGAAGTWLALSRGSAPESRANGGTPATTKPPSATPSPVAPGTPVNTQAAPSGSATPITAEPTGADHTTAEADAPTKAADLAQGAEAESSPDETAPPVPESDHAEPSEAERRAAAERRRRLRVQRARRKLEKHDKNADNRIQGQRTPGLSADDF